MAKYSVVTRCAEQKIKNIFGDKELDCALVNNQGCYYDQRPLSAKEVIKILRRQRLDNSLDRGYSWTSKIIVVGTDISISFDSVIYM